MRRKQKFWLQELHLVHNNSAEILSTRTRLFRLLSDYRSTKLSFSVHIAYAETCEGTITQSTTVITRMMNTNRKLEQQPNDLKIRRSFHRHCDRQYISVQYMSSISD